MIGPVEALKEVLVRKGVKADEITIVVSAPMGFGASSIQVAIFNMLKEAKVNVRMKNSRILVPRLRGQKVEALVPVHIVRLP